MPEPSRAKVQIPVRLDHETAERLRAAVYWRKGRSMQQIINRAIQKELAALDEEYFHETGHPKIPPRPDTDDPAGGDSRTKEDNGRGDQVQASR